MKLQDIKKQMLEYRDFFGGDLLDVAEVEKAKTKKQLVGIINRHNQHLDDMVADAQQHLKGFKRKVGLDNIF